MLTINIKGIEFDVEFDYQLEEKMIRHHSDCTCWPGCSASIESINKIIHKGSDFTKFFEDDLEDVEKVIWDTLNQTP